MEDKNILKLKFGLGAVSLILLVTGSKLLFAQWTSIHLSLWLLIGLIGYGTVYRTFKTLRSKNTQVIYNDFETAGTITYLVIISLTTIMLLIFYPLIALLFFGLSLATLSVFGGLKFISFDFDANKVDGLFVDRDTSLNKMTVDIHPDKNQIEIKTLDREDILLLKREKFNDKVWIKIIENFEKIGA